MPRFEVEEDETAMQSTSAADLLPIRREAWSSPQRRNLAGACLAHMLHDGYTDQLYALLPVWQSEFGLSYAGLAVVRALYYGTMGGLQVPGDRLIARLARAPRWRWRPLSRQRDIW